MADWDCDESEDELIQIIENLNVRLATLLEIDRKRAQLKQQLQAWQLEQEHFNNTIFARMSLKSKNSLY